MKSHDVALLHFADADLAPTNAWKIVVYFYAAVHAVNRHCFGHAAPATGFKHPQRFEHVAMKMRAVQPQYTALFSLAHDARYSALSLPMDDRDVAAAKAHAASVCAAAGISLPA